MFYQFTELGVRVDARGIYKIVCVKGKKRTISEDVNMTINPGEFVAFVGGSGAGKSTFMSFLCGLSKPTKGNVYINLLIVFILTGLWHGAQWSFVAWGLWHGIFILVEKYCKKHFSFMSKIPCFIRWVYTMSVVTIGWVFFRAHSMKDGLIYIKAMFGLNKLEFQPFGIRYYLNNRVFTVLVIAIIMSLIPFNLIRKKLQKYRNIEMFFKACSIILLVVCFIVMVNSSYSPFIYFRF